MSSVPAACSHEIRPGTTVCLHCRREAKLEASAKFRQLVMRGGIAAAVVGVVVVAGVAGAGALRSSRAATVEPGVAMQAASMTGPATDGPERPAPAPDSLLVAAGVRTDSGLKAVEPGTPPEQPMADADILAPTVPEGRTDLGGGVFAERFGDTVVVHFDTPQSRTRHAEKFAGVVRATLPRVYGSAARSLLAAAPSETFGRPVSELTDAAHPLHVGAMTLWGETREGQDGPLMVSYRVVATRQ
jgi:hypothetical protein